MAHPVPMAAREALARQLAPYRTALPDVRWTRPETWHLTLVFVGSVEPGRITELASLVDAVAAAGTPYRVRLDAGDGRMGRHEGVGWLRASVGGGELVALADTIAHGCPSDLTLGVPVRLTPSAHLTVARGATAVSIEALRTQALGTLDVAWTVDRMGLFRSHFEASGARYQTLHETAL